MDQEEFLFRGKMGSYIKGLEFQKERILSEQLDPGIVSPVHDADFYMVLLRRAYREIETASKFDSKIANLKGRNRDLAKKIKIRDHFEHDVDMDQVSETTPGVKMVRNLVIKNGEAKIISDTQEWSLTSDHKKFVDMIKEFEGLYPFSQAISNTNSKPLAVRLFDSTVDFAVGMASAIRRILS